MEKLFELHTEGDFDLLVLDTPPTRNALDFLDAPKRLTQFIEGSSLKVFMKPTGLAAKVAGRGASVALSVFKRIVGFDLLADLAEFFNAFSGMVDGFQARAKRVNKLLADPEHLLPRRLRPAGRAGRRGRLLPPQTGRGEAALRRRHRQQGPLPGRGAARRGRGPAGGAGREARRRGPGRAGRRQLLRLPGAGRARRPQHRAPAPRAAHQRRDPRPLPRRGRPRPRRPGRDQPLPVRHRRGAGRDGGGPGLGRPAAAGAASYSNSRCETSQSASGTGKRWRTRGVSIRSRCWMSRSSAARAIRANRRGGASETSSSQAWP